MLVQERLDVLAETSRLGLVPSSLKDRLLAGTHELVVSSGSQCFWLEHPRREASDPSIGFAADTLDTAKVLEPAVFNWVVPVDLGRPFLVYIC